MTEIDVMAGAPEHAETDPPNEAGRVANDPSVKKHGLVPEALQCPHGKPDGEVDTGNRNRPPASLFA